MVVIINGEVVQDDDPRAIALRNRGKSGANAAGGAGNARRPSGVGNVAGLGSANAAGGGGGGGGGGRGGGGSFLDALRGGGAGEAGAPPGQPDPDGPLGMVARTLGLGGKFVRVPPIAVLGSAEKQIPMIEVVLSAVLVVTLRNAGIALVILYALATGKF